MPSTLRSPDSPPSWGSLSAQRLEKLRRLRELKERSAEAVRSSDDARERHLARHRNGLDRACELNPRTKRTPALELIADALERAATTPGLRIIISIPPQEGKTTSVLHALVRKLQRHPESTNAIASYGADLATDSGRDVRDKIDTHGLRSVDPITGQSQDKLGIAVRHDHAAAGNWKLQGHDGGLYCIGVGGGLTGRSVTGLFVVDDPLKGMSEADSEAERRKLWKWWTSVSETRMAPETSVVVIQTRWHPEDLAGGLETADLELPAEEREWEVINIPAVAHPGVPDALEGVDGGRTENGYLVSARGRSEKLWDRIKRRVGARVWAAMYTGTPAPQEGGIFKREWIRNSRVVQAPPLDSIALAVDPADTGKSDLAGMVVAGRARDGQLYVLADLSGQLSQAQYARRACLGVLRWNAGVIVQERTLGMQSAVRDAWSVIRRQTLALREAPTNGQGDEDRVLPALAALDARGDEVGADEDQLRELLPFLDAVLARPSTAPVRIVTRTPSQSKKTRADAITNGYELATTHHVGTFEDLEFEMVTWQEGMKSPNRLDTLAHLLNHLDVGKVDAQVSSPAGSPRAPQRVGARPARVAVPRR